MRLLTDGQAALAPLERASRASRACAKGYRKMLVWTHGGLLAARGIDARRGFALFMSQPYQRLGPSLVGQTWALKP